MVVLPTLVAPGCEPADRCEAAVVVTLVVDPAGVDVTADGETTEVETAEPDVTRDAVLFFGLGWATPVFFDLAFIGFFSWPWAALPRTIHTKNAYRNRIASTSKSESSLSMTKNSHHC